MAPPTVQTPWRTIQSQRQMTEADLEGSAYLVTKKQLQERRRQKGDAQVSEELISSPAQGSSHTVTFVRLQ